MKDERQYEQSETSADAYVRVKGLRCIIGTDAVEKTLLFADGVYRLTSFTNKLSGRDFAGLASDEFSVTVDGVTYTGSSGGWDLDDFNVQKLQDGVLQLDVLMHRQPIQIKKTYLIYPGESIIREWAQFKNISTSPITLTEPYILNMGVIGGKLPSLDFHWMTGGVSIPGSWTLKTEKLSKKHARVFDSYDVPPFAAPPPGDGINAKILANEVQVWPKEGWQYVPDSSVQVEHDQTVTVAAGDRLYFIVNMNKNVSNDTTRWNPTIIYEDGETYKASAGFSGKQGENGWFYQYWDGSQYVDLVFDSAVRRWRRANTETVHPFISEALQHPDWLLGNTLDQSRPEVVEYEKKLLDSFAERFGDFEWRNDSSPLSPRNGDDTPLLGQDQGFREVLKHFLDSHPHCAFMGVNGGGNGLGYEYLRMASAFQFTDGGVGLLNNYYLSYLFPPDKVCHMPDVWNPDKYDKATWRGLLSSNFDMTGDTWDVDKLEGIREIIDIYHYLQSVGVVGRWVKIYHPIIIGDDPTMYLQRMSRDNLRGIIITKHQVPGEVTIKPKGLLPDNEVNIDGLQHRRRLYVERH